MPPTTPAGPSGLHWTTGTTHVPGRWAGWQRPPFLGNAILLECLAHVENLKAGYLLFAVQERQSRKATVIQSTELKGTPFERAYRQPSCPPLSSEAGWAVGGTEMLLCPFIRKHLTHYPIVLKSWNPRTDDTHSLRVKSSGGDFPLFKVTYGENLKFLVLKNQAHNAPKYIAS